MKMKRKQSVMITILSVVFMTIMVAFTLYPIIYTIFGSLKTNFELTRGGGFFPKKLMFSNYVYAFKQANFLKYSVNSFILCTITSVLALITSSMAGYVMAKHEFIGKKLLMSLYLGLMFVSLGAVSLYPQYLLMNTVGFTKSLLGLGLVLTGGQAANIFLVMGFAKTIPYELESAAYIDGCTPFGVYFKIMLPLIKPILAVVVLFTFRTTWNDYITSLVFTMSKPDLKPLTVAVVGLRYSANAAAEWNIMVSGAAIAILPIMIVYIFANRQFISGLTAGAVKG